MPPVSPTPRRPTDSVPLMPCLLLSRGRVMRPGPEGPVAARSPDGSAPDVLDVTERLGNEFGRLFVVDLDGVERNRPQLDYLQEIARDGEIWVDAGVRSAEEAIDVLVAGAYRAVLSTTRLPDLREARRAWRMSTEVAFELEVRGRAVSGSEAWQGRAPEEVAQELRALGVEDLILSFREEAVDWALVATLAPPSPLWVGGTFEASEAARLRPAGAAGGIFHLDERLGEASGSVSATAVGKGAG